MNVTETLFSARLVAIYRGDYRGRWSAVTEALQAGGIVVIEVTLNSPEALSGLRELRKAFGERMVIGAGTVLSAEQVHSVFEAGAQFIVAPNTDDRVIEACHKRGLPVIPGAYTPTEVVRAFEAGVTMVKLFPATTPTYVQAVHAPLDQIPLMVTGGVNTENAVEYLRAGASALGLGSSLTKPDLPLSEITARAKALVAAVALYHEQSR